MPPKRLYNKHGSCVDQTLKDIVQNRVIIGIDLSISSSAVSVCDSKNRLLYWYVFRSRVCEKDYVHNLTDGIFQGWSMHIVFKPRVPKLTNDRFIRYMHIVTHIMKVIRCHHGPNTTIGIEHYSYGSTQTNALTCLYELGTCMRLQMYVASFQFVEISPCSVKKRFTGDGRADKKKMVSQCASILGIDSICDVISGMGIAPRNTIVIHPLEDAVDAFAVSISIHIQSNTSKRKRRKGNHVH